MKKIVKENLPALFRAIAAQQDLFLPIKTAGQTNFGLWTEEAEVDLETLKTVKSGKDMFFPQSETLYTCLKDDKKIYIKPEALQDRNFVAFGMKGCDVKGLEVLDRVFLADPVDTFYAARRKHGIIVAMACNEPETSCFCKVFGVDCAEPSADVAVWLTSTALCWKAQTEKGEALTATLTAAGLLEEATEADLHHVEGEKAVTRAIVEKLPYMNLSLEGWNGEALNEKFNSPLWEKLYKAAWPVVPAPLCAPPASATISRTTRPVPVSRDIAAGTAACILILP